jgi:hypothetical protein
VSRLSKKLKKFVRKAAPIAAVVGLGFALGPAGAGIGKRILGGLGRVAKTGAKLAGPVVQSVLQGQSQQSTASPGFDQSTAAIPDEQVFTRGLGRHRPRFAGTLPEPVEAEPVSRFASGGKSMSLTGSLQKLAASSLQKRLGKQIGLPLLTTPVPFTSRVPQITLPGAGAFRTGGTMEQFGRPRSKRINPTNVKALRRALRRVEGFVKLEKRVDKILRRAAPAARTARKSGFVKRR